MTGGNMTNREFPEWRSKEWKEETNKVIANNLIKEVQTLLNAEVYHVLSVDKVSSHRKIVIEYDHST